MAFQPVPNGVEVVFHATQNGVPVVNVFHVQDTSELDTTRLLEIADQFKAWWGAHIAPNIHESYVLGDITVTALETIGGPQVVRNYSTGNVGALTTAPTAANAAAVISWRTAKIGRNFRGRTYVGGLTASAFTNAQTLTSGFATDMADAGSALIDGMIEIGAKLAVLSRFVAGVLRVAGLLTEIISVIVDTKSDSQRKRTAN